jgi:nitrite reductase (NO-forming)
VKQFASTILLVLALTAGGWVVPEGRFAFAGESEQTVKVTASEFWFKPTEVTVKPGPVTFMVTNAGGVAHTFVIEKVKNARIDEIDPGKTGTLKITLQGGKYTAFCDVPGHREAGMVMTIIVK